MYLCVCVCVYYSLRFSRETEPTEEETDRQTDAHQGARLILGEAILRVDPSALFAPLCLCWVNHRLSTLLSPS